MVVMESGTELIVNTRDFSTVNPVASRNVKIWVSFPVITGVPLMTPLGSRIRPPGRGGEPLLMPHV